MFAFRPRHRHRRTSATDRPDEALVVVVTPAAATDDEPARTASAGPDHRIPVAVLPDALGWFQIESLAAELADGYRLVGGDDDTDEPAAVLLPVLTPDEVRAVRRRHPRAALIVTTHGTLPGPRVAAVLEAGADTCVTSATVQVVAAYVRSLGRRVSLVA